MAKKTTKISTADKKPDQPVLLECLPSQDGKKMCCTLVTPEDAKKILQKHAATTVSATVSSPTPKDRTEQKYIEPDTPTDLDSDSGANDASTIDDCTSECTMFDEENISSSLGDQPIEEGSEAGGCEDD